MYTRRRSICALGTVVATLCGLLIVSAPPGSAHRLGGKWAHPNYSYFTSVNGYTGYLTPISNAAGLWSSRTVFSMSEGPPTSAPVGVFVDNYDNTDWIGIGIPGPNVSSGTYTYATVHANTYWLNGRHFNCASPGPACKYPADTASQRQCVIGHELGHTIGLAHTAESPAYRSIMNPDHGKRCHSWALVGPQTHDINDVAGIY